jgi:hypothetical protein
VPGRPRQLREAAHEGATDAENVEMHEKTLQGVASPERAKGDVVEGPEL